MRNRIVIYTHNKKSQSAKRLKLELEKAGITTVIRHSENVGLAFKNDLVINWGNSRELPYYSPILNFPPFVRGAIDKRDTFRILAGKVRIPESFDGDFFDVSEIRKKVEQGQVILGRKLTRASQGRGIIVMDTPDKVEKCPLYTVYKKKKKEFRVHVFNGKVIFLQEKRRRKGELNVNEKIRSYSNGWVFCKENVNAPEDVVHQACKAVDVLGLNFGAVDVIWNEKEQAAYVLEVNTAPGIEGTSLQKYTEAFLKCFHQG